MTSLLPKLCLIEIGSGNAGRIIGKQGTTIRAIRNLSGVRAIDVPKFNSKVRIEGDDEAIAMAVKLIDKILGQKSTKTTTTTTTAVAKSFK